MLSVLRRFDQRIFSCKNDASQPVHASCTRQSRCQFPHVKAICHNNAQRPYSCVGFLWRRHRCMLVRNCCNKVRRLNNSIGFSPFKCFFSYTVGMAEVAIPNEEFSSAPQAISSAEARELCDSSKHTLLSSLQPHLTDFPQPLDAEDLKDAVLELQWLQVAKNQGTHCQLAWFLLLCPIESTGTHISEIHAAGLMGNAHLELGEMQRTLRTANRRESTDAELSPAVTRLLHKAAAHLRNASQVRVSLLQPLLLHPSSCVWEGLPIV